MLTLKGAKSDTLLTVVNFSFSLQSNQKIYSINPQALFSVILDLADHRRRDASMG